MLLLRKGIMKAEWDFFQSTTEESLNELGDNLLIPQIVQP